MTMPGMQARPTRSERGISRFPKPGDFADFVPLAVIIGLSLLTYGAWALINPIGYTSDSTTYVQLAEYLAQKSPPSTFLFFRTPGYPLLLMLGGLPWTRSFVGILWIQALMAVSIPVLFYRTVHLYYPRPAFIFSVLLIATLVPVAYAKDVMPDQSFMF